MLRLAITAVAQSRGVRVVSLLGSSPGAGTTTLAVWLARSLARESRQTLLVDGNRANPRLHELFQLSGEPGVVDLLEAGTGANQALRPTADPNLRVLPYGSRVRPITPSIEQCRTLLSGLAANQLVLTDGGSAGTASALTMCAASDGVALVVKCGQTSRQEIDAIRNRLSLSRTELLGVVVNQRRHFTPEVIYRRA
jgi:Mrp family chromosome partitioning ATPase